AGWKVRLSAPLLGYFFGSLRRRAVAARLRALPRAAVRRGWWQVATVALFTLLLSYCGLTNAKPEEPPSVSSDAQSIQFDGKTYRNLDELRIAKPGIFAPLSSSIMERKEYDVATMMKRLTGDGHSIDQAQQLLLAAIQQIHPEPSSYSVKRIKFREGKLLATGTPDAHAELTRKLKLWESAGLSVQIRVELGYLSLAKNETEQLAAEWKNIATRMPVEWPEEEMLSAMEDTYVAPDPFESPAAAPQKVWAQSPKPGGPPFIYALLSPNQAKVAIDCAEMRNSAVAATPQLLLNGTGGEFKSVTQLPLTANMKGFEGAAESFQVGSKLQVQPTLSEDQKQIPLDTRIELRQADMANAPTVREEGKVIPIPSIKAMFTGGRFDLEDGHSLLIGSTQSLQGGADSARYHYFLLTAKKVTGATVSK
ncbi:MAG: hypothetical protein SGJ20_22750, partial [Planctomycetota bacterium]|nr:hypothetical protein [Planctomycetota bacterium]